MSSSRAKGLTLYLVRFLSQHLQSAEQAQEARTRLKSHSSQRVNDRDVVGRLARAGGEGGWRLEAGGGELTLRNTRRPKTHENIFLKVVECECISCVHLFRSFLNSKKV